MKVRVRFTKGGCLVFIGHLDVMRYFQKALRRADIDIKYTTGYSPHQIMSFASPLGLSITSEGEYMDIEIGESISSAEAVRRINETMAEGISVLSFKKLPDDAPNAMASIAAAEYTVRFREGMEPSGNWQEELLAFCSQPVIEITKKTKKSEKTIDLKERIIDIRRNDDGTVYMKVTAGSADNVKPELVVGAYMEKVLGREYVPYSLLIHRLDLFANGGTPEKPIYRSLESYGEDIL